MSRPGSITMEADHAHPRGLAPGENSATVDRKLSWSIALNSLIALVEVGGGLLSGSLALLSDALHNLGDVTALGLAVDGNVKVVGKVPSVGELKKVLSECAGKAEAK